MIQDIIEAEQGDGVLGCPFLWLDPGGDLHWQPDSNEATGLTKGFRERYGSTLEKDAVEALWWLGGRTLAEDLPPSLAFWRGLAHEFFHQLCRLPRSEGDEWPSMVPFPGDEWATSVVKAAPPLFGMEFLTPALLDKMWARWHEIGMAQITPGGKGLSDLLQAMDASWRLVGRVTLHLAENKTDTEFPFAFLATYSQRLDAAAGLTFVALSRAVKESAESGNQERLLHLLQPVHEAAKESEFLKELLETRRIFQPLRLSVEEAWRFLRDVPVMEGAGLVVRVPDWWASRGSKVVVAVTIDAGEETTRMGAGSLLRFQVAVAVGKETLTKEEIEALMQSEAPLITLKGKWVEVDRRRLREALAHWDKARAALQAGVPFHVGMRWLAGLPAQAPEVGMISSDILGVVDFREGDSLRERLNQWKATGPVEAIPGLAATLRPYQREGVGWLQFASRLGLGVCLADDMGLGKTLQVIAFFLLRQANGEAIGPHLLVLPASLIGNWVRELRKFAPTLRFRVMHRSFDSESWQRIEARSSVIHITTYGMVSRVPEIKNQDWDVVVLDEAQAIKNAGTEQSRQMKQLKGKFRLTLTGTPVENRLSDLWSLFDFMNPGLLGSPVDFATNLKDMKATHGGYGPLRQLVAPFILRRMKTDPTVISDLPRKTEVKAFCYLKKRQATLYQRVVRDLARQLPQSDEKSRKGDVLSAIMKLKQICNHPSLMSGDGLYDPEESGKLERLGEIARQVSGRQEKMLVFTQFKEMCEPLAGFLAGVWGRPGLVLHGGIPVAQRSQLVERFQAAGGPGFFVISVKAGGTGLNVTAASHVVHFDRWWNPAVEDQATDRAYRIGQTRPVVVHKFVCQGTMEEKLDQLIDDKKEMADEILGGGEESGAQMLLGLDDDALLEFLAPGLSSAL